LSLRYRLNLRFHLLLKSLKNHSFPWSPKNPYFRLSLRFHLYLKYLRFRLNPNYRLNLKNHLLLKCLKNPM